jgi:hypothetical protein
MAARGTKGAAETDRWPRPLGRGRGMPRNGAGNIDLSIINGATPQLKAGGQVVEGDFTSAEKTTAGRPVSARGPRGEGQRAT